MQDLLVKVQALGKSRLCSRKLAGDCCQVVPQSTGHFKEANHVEPRTGAKTNNNLGGKGHGFESLRHQGFLIILA